MARAGLSRGLPRDSAIAALAISPFWRVLGANDRINLAAIGVRHGRQRRAVDQVPSVQFTDVCDVDQRRWKVQNLFEDKYKLKLEATRISARSSRKGCGRGLHRHARPLARSSSSRPADGQDIYCEKPISTTSWKGGPWSTRPEIQPLVQIGSWQRSVQRSGRHRLRPLGNQDHHGVPRLAEQQQRQHGFPPPSTPRKAWLRLLARTRPFSLFQENRFHWDAGGSAKPNGNRRHRAST